MQPEIAAIPEMWTEKFQILAQLNQRSGDVWAFAPGGVTETFNDAETWRIRKLTWESGCAPDLKIDAFFLQETHPRHERPSGLIQS